MFRACLLFVFVMMLPGTGGMLRSWGQTSELSQDIIPSAAHRRVVRQIVLLGNESTRGDAILRELLFGCGDTLSGDELQRAMRLSQRNLMNTGAFNFVQIGLLPDASPPEDFVLDGFSGQPAEPQAVDIYLQMVERWYIWPVPILELGERNLNEWLDEPSLSRLNYGMYLQVNNLGGKLGKLQLLARLGYRQDFRFMMESPWVNPAKTLRWSLMLGWQQSREFPYMTLNNIQQFYKAGGFVFQNQQVFTALSYRPRVFATHHFSLQFDRFAFADTLTRLNPRFSPAQQSQFSFFSLGYRFVYEQRDLKAYPLEGYYAEIGFLQQGIGLLDGGKKGVGMIDLTYSHYEPLQAGWYAAVGFRGKWSGGPGLSYFNQQGLGFHRDLVRGYEPYVLDGQWFGIVKTNLKYNLLPQRVSRLRFISSERFSLIHYALYLNAFFDWGYVGDRYFSQGNPLNNAWLGGAGLGLDFVTYYDKVLRTEFSLNRKGKAGLYFHLIAPI